MKGSYKVGRSAGMLVLVSAFLWVACLPDPVDYSPELALQQQLDGVDRTQLEKDLKIIDDSLTRWGITALKESHGVRYTIETTGTGDKPKLTSRIKAKYSGRLLNTGALFTKATDTLYIPLYDLVVGWQTAVPLMPKGSKFKLFIPSGYAYGNVDIRNTTTNAIIVPKNSNLIFDVELLDVQN